MIRYYGTTKSRAARVALALVELDLEFEHIPLVPRPGTEDRETLRRINPNCHIPVIDDDGLIIWESMAINLYLAEKYGGEIVPRSAEEKAITYQWSFWQQTEIDRADWNRDRRSGDDDLVKAAIAATVDTLRILDDALEGRDYLLGDRFTLADLNLAGSMSQPNESGRIGWQKIEPGTEGLNNLAAWLDRCTARDSWAKVAEMD